MLRDRKCSVSYIQRRLSVGYNKARRVRGLTNLRWRKARRRTRKDEPDGKSPERRSFFAALPSGRRFNCRRRRQGNAPRQKSRRHHVDDLDKVGEALANLRNHIIGTGGPGKADLKVVINGPGAEAFHAKAPTRA